MIAINKKRNLLKSQKLALDIVLPIADKMPMDYKYGFVGGGSALEYPKFKVKFDAKYRIRDRLEFCFTLGSKFTSGGSEFLTSSRETKGILHFQIGSGYDNITSVSLSNPNLENIILNIILDEARAEAKESISKYRSFARTYEVKAEKTEQVLKILNELNGAGNGG